MIHPIPVTIMVSTIDKSVDTDVEDEDEPVPQRLGRYIIQRRLGKGGFGSGGRQRLGADVCFSIDAIKALKAKTPEVSRADIEVQVSLADAMDEALASGEATKPDVGPYQVGTYKLPGAEVDRWRKLRAITSFYHTN